MRKIKHFKVSVIVHTMSKAAYDQNIFYTSDTDLALVFELLEKEYKYDRAEILLYNETDKSFVTRDINKVDDSFVYQIESDIIQHHGEWVGQLQLSNNGEVYTSKPFKFTIENDLSTVSPPTLTDINNWSSLKNSANELIAEMQTVISENETAAIAYQQAENIRSENEKQRVISESTRENHETTRQNQERVRNANEENRKTNETERQNNEAVRKANETERRSAESIRVENEEQRKIDHENRSAELAGKADKEQEDWITPTLLNGWEHVSTGLKYRKDSIGNIHIIGRVRGGIDGAIFTLPLGYRPTFIFTGQLLSNWKPKNFFIGTSGTVTLNQLTDNDTSIWVAINIIFSG